ncbi:MAG: TldD/PmbA family protein [Acidimicrobiia bacterium]|nr:TldD/PmbA family protein [Acidimicrobiia bacterium]
MSAPTAAAAANEDTTAELLRMAERLAAQAGPGEQVEAYVARGSSTSVRAYDGEVESLSVAQSAGVGIRVVADDRQGFASCGSLDPEVVAETLADARDNARHAEPDEALGLARPDGVVPVHQELWFDEVVQLPTDEKVRLAIELERATTGADERVRSVRTAMYGDGAGEAAIATSTGISAAGRGTTCHLSVAALARDGSETRMGGGSDVARTPGELDLDQVAADAVERATRLLGATPVPSRRLTVVLEPRLAATIVCILGGTLTGERLLKGRTPFADRVGEVIGSPLLTVVDDPTDPRSMGADPHDGEGLATRRNELVRAGELVGFLHNTWTARRLGVASTASAVRSYASTPGVGCQALAVTPGEGTHDELVAAVDDGILVQSLTGLHSGVNAVSGDISVGAEGLLIRGGALAEPVCEVTLATTLQRLLTDIEAVGADLEWQPSGTGAVTLVIGDVTLSGR